MTRPNSAVSLSALALLLVALLTVLSIHDSSPVGAQSRATHQINPSTLGTYFDIDASTGVATLKSEYKRNSELVFAAGSYTNGLKIEGARNVTLRGANSARSANAAILKPYKPIVSAEGTTRQSTLEVSGSTDVTVSGFRFDFACLNDEEAAGNRDSSLTPPVVHYRLHGIMYSDSSGVIADNFIGNYFDMWFTLGLIVKPNPPGNDGNELGDNYRDLNASFIPPEREANHCGNRSRDGTPANNRATFGAIQAISTSAHVPTVGADGKVGNLRPIRIEDNEVVHGVKPAIGISGWYDFTIQRNTIRKANNAIDISGGASGRVLANTIEVANLGIVYAPSWALKSNPTGRNAIEALLIAHGNRITNFSGSAFAVGFNHCADANKDGITVHTNAEIISNHVSRYIYSSNNPVATAGVEIVVTSHFPHSYGPAEGVAHRRTFGCSDTEPSDGERITANIIANTFEQIGPILDDAGNEHPTERPVAILAVPPNPDFASDGRWQTTHIEGYSAWFEVNAHHNDFIGHDTAVRIRSGRIEHGEIDATNNHWGTGSTSPENRIDNQQSDVASVTHAPWLHTADRAGYEGAYERQVLPFTVGANPEWNANVPTLTVDQVRFVNLENAFEIRDAASLSYTATSSNNQIVRSSPIRGSTLRLLTVGPGIATVVVTAWVDSRFAGQQSFTVRVGDDATPVPTPSPIPTLTPTPTATPVVLPATPTPTNTPVPIPTNTPTPTPEPTPTSTPIPPTATPTDTPVPVTPTATPEPTGGGVGPIGIIVGLIVLAALGAGAFYVVRRRGTETEGGPDDDGA